MAPPLCDRGRRHVQIDYETVETLASKKPDRTTLPIAQVMLAVRGRTWKPVQ